MSTKYHVNEIKNLFLKNQKRFKAASLDNRAFHFVNGHGLLVVYSIPPGVKFISELFVESMDEDTRSTDCQTQPIDMFLKEHDLKMDNIYDRELIQLMSQKSHILELLEKVSINEVADRWLLRQQFSSIETILERVINPPEPVQGTQGHTHECKTCKRIYHSSGEFPHGWTRTRDQDGQAYHVCPECARIQFAGKSWEIGW